MNGVRFLQGKIIHRAIHFLLPAVAGLVLAVGPIVLPVAAATTEEENTIAAYNKVVDSVVLVLSHGQEVNESEGYREISTSGSGILIDEHLIVTNYHVIENATGIDVILGDGQSLTVSIVGTAPDYDIALLKTQEQDVPVVETGDSDQLRIGQKLLAVGSPFGLENSVTVGIVSGLDRRIMRPGFGADLIQFDASINPGQSGGPVVDSDGKVVGVILAKVQDGESVGFAIPINLVLDLIPDLVRMGHPFRPQIGLSGTDITPDLATIFGIDSQYGFLVEDVEENSEARAAGIRGGDRIILLGGREYRLGGDVIQGVNGRSVFGGEDLARILLRSRPGEEVEFLIRRNGESLRTRVRIPPMRHTMN